MSESVCIKSCATEQEAEVVKAVLEANGIHAMVSAGDYVGLPLTLSDGVKIFVLEEDADNARDLLANAADD
jgi:hypothetical protein